MTSKHSKIGASSMSRWQACPGSVALCEGLESIQSEYAKEGQCAHDIANYCLKHGLANAADCPKEKQVEFALKYETAIHTEMFEAIDVYLETVRYEMLKYPDAEWKSEEKLHLTDIHDNAFGTTDFRLYCPITKRLSVKDYKHGAGVPVEVEDNPQGLYYALGSALKLNKGIETVEISIIQPRCPHPDGPIRSWTLSAMNLLDWAAELESAIKATEDPNAPRNPGKGCRWCPAAAICPELEAQVMEETKNDFKDVVKYDPEKLSKALAKCDMAAAWAKSVRKFAYYEANSGRPIPGFKLVAKRGNRIYIDPEQAAEELKLMLGDEAHHAPKLLSPAEIEKIIGKSKDARETIAHLIHKVSSGNTLAPVSDKRPEVSAGPEADFAEVAE